MCVKCMTSRTHGCYDVAVNYPNPEWSHRKGGCLACEGCTDLYNARGAQGILSIRVGYDQSIESTVIDAIFSSRLWSTATSSPNLATSVDYHK